MCFFLGDLLNFRGSVNAEEENGCRKGISGLCHRVELNDTCKAQHTEPGRTQAKEATILIINNELQTSDWTSVLTFSPLNVTKITVQALQFLKHRPHSAKSWRGNYQRKEMSTKLWQLDKRWRDST